MAQFIKQGFGFTVGGDFARAMIDMPILRIAADEYAKPHHVIAYIAPDPYSSFGFLRNGKEIRVHVQQTAIGEV